MIYFFQGELTRLVKIGVTSTNDGSRLRQCQCGSPDKLVLLGMIHQDQHSESVLHKQFKHLRDHGEWFRPGEELLEFIRVETSKPKRIIPRGRLFSPRKATFVSVMKSST